MWNTGHPNYRVVPSQFFRAPALALRPREGNKPRNFGSCMPNSLRMKEYVRMYEIEFGAFTSHGSAASM